MSLLTTEMNRDALGDSAYSNTGGGVRRLNPVEEENPQLRADNKELVSYLSYPAVPARADNKYLEAELQGHPLKSNFTDYLNEAPIVREHNENLMEGGSLIGGEGGVYHGGSMIRGGDLQGTVKKVGSAVSTGKTIFDIGKTLFSFL